MVDARWFKKWASGGLAMSGGLDNGYQVDVQVSLSEGNQETWTCESFRG